MHSQSQQGGEGSWRRRKAGHDLALSQAVQYAYSLPSSFQQAGALHKRGDTKAGYHILSRASHVHLRSVPSFQATENGFPTRPSWHANGQKQEFPGVSLSTSSQLGSVAFIHHLRQPVMLCTLRPQLHVCKTGQSNFHGSQ